MAVQRATQRRVVNSGLPKLEQVDINIIFTGLCSYAITPTIQGPKVTFVMPNNRQWRNSLNEGSVRIPPHRAFLIAREDDVAFENNAWKGEPPTGRFQDRWVYWIFDGDNIYLDQERNGGVKIGNVSDVIDLPTLCSDAEVSDACLGEQDCEQVEARVMFKSGRLSQRSLTTSQYTLQPCRGRAIGPKEIADEVQIAILDVPQNSNGEIVFKRCALDGSRDGRNPIILRPVDPLIKIFFGSAPEVDLSAVVSRAPNHSHDSTNAHFELHYSVSKRRPYAPVPVPKTAGSVTRNGPINGTDRCPPASSKGTGTTVSAT